jgi:glycosyltransferase involved in cell wall biosynthesis
VIAHRANAYGLPEMRHEYNALLASTGEGLASEIIRAFHDEELRWHLSLKGRETYERFFSYEVTSRKIFAELERVAKAENMVNV